MKKKRFYKNKDRNQKWTEQPTGRKIYFADKYVDAPKDTTAQIKQKRAKEPFFTKKRFGKLAKGLIAAVASIALIGTGYTIMDIHLERRAMPFVENEENNTANLNNIAISIKGSGCQSLSLDGGLMLGAVIDTAADNGYTSLAFDLKRNDGTIGYNSSLATISSFGAISSPSGDLKASANLLKENDVLPIGIISCYKDNIAPAADPSLAMLNGGSLFKDSAGNTYLNPSADNAYNYIKSIVDEAMGMGVTVFVLDNYDLPAEAGENNDSGFDKLVEKLYADFNDELKLLKAIGINLTSDSAKALDEEWQEKIENYTDNDSNSVFCITAKNPTIAKQYLDSKGITNYIIFE